MGEGIRRWRHSLIIFFALIAAPALAEPVPRTLVALYDSREEASPATTLIHRYLELPANHLGFVVHYYDINAPLPSLGDDVRGILIWFNSGMEVPDANAYFDWLDTATRAGKKLVVLENAGLGDRLRADPIVMDRAARIFSRIGVKDTNRWQSLTYSVSLKDADPAMTGFERPYETTLPPYMDTRALPKATSHLKAVARESESGKETVSDLIITSKRGGYVANGYTLYQVAGVGEARFQQWYINPLEFLERSLDAADLPRADATTLDGERIFFAAIDGDGWNDAADLPGYRDRRDITGTALTQEILKPYADIPFSLGLIASDLDNNCYGLKESASAANAALSLPNISPASHTQSHPLYWRFFAGYTPLKEQPFLARYPAKPIERSSLVYALLSIFAPAWRPEPANPPYAVPPPGRYDISEEEAITRYYKTPRSYACAPFDLKNEIAGAAQSIAALSPKPVQLIHWSGDTRPFPEALAMARASGLANLGGGDVNFNPDYPSYAGLPPLGLASGEELQVYAANGNEIAAPGEAHAPVAPAQYFQALARFSDSPVRLRALGLYAHARAAASPQDLQAFKDNLEWVRSAPLIPIPANDYATIVQGFGHAAIRTLGPERWQVEDRGALGTLRFDRATLKSVDFTRSHGVLGQRWRAGSLYVALDPLETAPIIALQPIETFGIYPPATQPYLISSRWQIKGLQIANNSLTFTGQGNDLGRMTWRMPHPGNYRIEVTGDNGLHREELINAPGGLLALSINASAVTPVTITITEAE